LITGIAGQDGSYLAEQLLESGYRVCGVARSLAPSACERIAHIVPRLELREGDVFAPDTLAKAISAWRPDEVYHLAADSFAHGWSLGDLQVQRSAVACERLFDAVARDVPAARVVLASSSEVFGLTAESPQSERTPIAPATPYGQAKAEALVAAARARQHGLHASCAILYNHESPRRSPRFVTRKVTLAAAAIAAGRQPDLVLGNLDARRDWGAATEYVDALQRMARQDEPSDFVLGSGRARSVRDLCEIAFAAVGLVAGDFVRTDESLVLAVDATSLVADSTRAHARLGWAAQRTLEDVVTEMVAADSARLAEVAG
jgi:GDPmannose 4,6-dehydratase